MMKSLLLLLTLGSSVCVAQADSIQIPKATHPVFRVRSVAVEASTFWLYYGGFGGIADVDLVEISSSTVQSAGIRAAYQEYHKGAILFDAKREPLAITRGLYLRASFNTENTRSDALIGLSTGDPLGKDFNSQLVFGVDIHAFIVKPLAGVFGRIIGSRTSIAAQFGVTVGFMN